MTRFASLAFVLLTSPAWAQGFGTSTTIPTTGGLDPLGVTLADFDADGDRDMVVSISDGATHQIEIFTNTGGGNFTSAGVVAAPGGATALGYIAAANVNGAGQLDVVCTAQGAAGPGGDGICVWLNTSPVGGPLSFAADAFYASTNADPTKLIVGQLDGAAFDDVVVASFDLTTPETNICRFLHTGGGAGTFYTAALNIVMPVAETPVGISAGDLDGDGDLDLAVGIVDGGTAVSTGVAIFTNSGAGVFTNAPGSPIATSAGFAWPNETEIADLNGAAPNDVAALDFPNPFAATQRVEVWVNNPPLTFGLVAGSPFGPADTNNNIRSTLCAINVDGDADIDLVAAFTSGNVVRAFINSGTGTFPTSMSQTAGGFPVDMACGDVNGDNLQDLLVADTTANGILRYLQIPNPAFAGGGGTGNTRGGGGAKGWLPCGVAPSSNAPHALCLSLGVLGLLVALARRFR